MNDMVTTLTGINMVPAAQLTSKLEGLGFDRVEQLHGSTYKDNSTVIIVPTRGNIHHKTVTTWQALIPMMNQKRSFMFAVGDEVGVAYNSMIRNVLNNPELSTWKYIMTLEDDNLPPPDTQQKLTETIEQGYDAVSGIYFTKGDINMPQAYGDPDYFRTTGKLEFRPRNIVDALHKGKIVEVNGIAMGCALWRMDLFREISEPWFVTTQEWDEEKGIKCYTQDLYFCERARRIGKRFAVDLRVRVGHMDVNTSIVY